MAFALLAQGANGVAQWGLPHTFEDGPNSGTAIGRETTAPTEPGDPAAVGRNHRPHAGRLPQDRHRQHQEPACAEPAQADSRSPTRRKRSGSLAGGSAIRPCSCAKTPSEQPLDDFAVLFVPGVQFRGRTGRAGRQAAAKMRSPPASKWWSKADSVLDLPGLIKLDDWTLNSYFVGDNYFPTWEDDELNKVYEKSQPTVDYLGPKLKEWNIEPAARGPFKVGPGWRDGGEIDYLVMANFEDPGLHPHRAAANGQAGADAARRSRPITAGWPTTC